MMRTGDSTLLASERVDCEPTSMNCWVLRMERGHSDVQAFVICQVCSKIRDDLGIDADSSVFCSICIIDDNDKTTSDHFLVRTTALSQLTSGSLSQGNKVATATLATYTFYKESVPLPGTLVKSYQVDGQYRVVITSTGKCVHAMAQYAMEKQMLTLPPGLTTYGSDSSSGDEQFPSLREKRKIVAAFSTSTLESETDKEHSRRRQSQLLRSALQTLRAEAPHMRQPTHHMPTASDHISGGEGYTTVPTAVYTQNAGSNRNIEFLSSGVPAVDIYNGGLDNTFPNNEELQSEEERNVLSTSPTQPSCVPVIASPEESGIPDSQETGTTPSYVTLTNVRVPSTSSPHGSWSSVVEPSFQEPHRNLSHPVTPQSPSSSATLDSAHQGFLPPNPLLADIPLDLHGQASAGTHSSMSSVFLSTSQASGASQISPVCEVNDSSYHLQALTNALAAIAEKSEDVHASKSILDEKINALHHAASTGDYRMVNSDIVGILAALQVFCCKANAVMDTTIQRVESLEITASTLKVAYNDMRTTYRIAAASLANPLAIAMARKEEVNEPFNEENLGNFVDSVIMRFEREGGALASQHVQKLRIHHNSVRSALLASGDQPLWPPNEWEFARKYTGKYADLVPAPVRSNPALIPFESHYYLTSEKFHIIPTGDDVWWPETLFRTVYSSVACMPLHSSEVKHYEHMVHEIAVTYRHEMMSEVEHWNTWRRHPRPIFQKRMAEVERAIKYCVEYCNSEYIRKNQPPIPLDRARMIADLVIGELADICAKSRHFALNGNNGPPKAFEVYQFYNDCDFVYPINCAKFRKDAFLEVFVPSKDLAMDYQVFAKILGKTKQRRAVPQQNENIPSDDPQEAVMESPSPLRNDDIDVSGAQAPIFPQNSILQGIVLGAPVEPNVVPPAVLTKRPRGRPKGSKNSSSVSSKRQTSGGGSTPAKKRATQSVMNPSVRGNSASSLRGNEIAVDPHARIGPITISPPHQQQPKTFMLPSREDVSNVSDMTAALANVV